MAKKRGVTSLRPNVVFDSSGSNAQWLRHRIDLAKRKGPPRLVLEWKLEMTHVENVRMEVLFFFF